MCAFSGWTGGGANEWAGNQILKRAKRPKHKPVFAVKDSIKQFCGKWNRKYAIIQVSFMVVPRARGMGILKKVYFVIDNQTKSEYVKKIIKLNPAIIPEEDTLIAIFNEIRDVQAGKKNVSVVEGITLEAPDEALNYGRHLTTTEIRLLVLNRILNQNVVGSKVPQSFIDTYIRFPEEKRKNMLEDCQLDLSRALFNCNCQDDFWKLFENIYKIIVENPSDDIGNLYRKLDKTIVGRCMDFDTLSLKYFISVIKDGIDL